MKNIEEIIEAIEQNQDIIQSYHENELATFTVHKEKMDPNDPPLPEYKGVSALVHIDIPTVFDNTEKEDEYVEQLKKIFNTDDVMFLFQTEAEHPEDVSEYNVWMVTYRVK